MRALFVVAVTCVAAGCATPEPSHGELQKGAYRPPVRAPTFSPSEDAPHTFQPGKPSPIQPGPRPTRVLPQTPETRREPGIWASKPPQDEPAVTLDWSMPLPEKDEPVAERMRQCIAAMRRGTERVLHPHTVKGFDNINIQWRGCWPHAAVMLCLEQREKAAHMDALVKSAAKREAEILTRAAKFAEDAYARNCGGGQRWSPGVDEKLEEAWLSR